MSKTIPVQIPQAMTAYRIKPGVFYLDVIDEANGYGLFEHEDGQRQFIRMSLMEEQPDLPTRMMT